MQDFTAHQNHPSIDDILEWLGEKPGTWRNIKAMCRNANRRLVQLKVSALGQPLSSEDYHNYHLLSTLLDGTLSLLPLPLNPATKLDSTESLGAASEAAKLEALYIPLSKLRKIIRT